MTMMDFEDAAQRLARDQAGYRGRNRNVVISSKAKKQAEFRKKQQEKMRVEREKKKRQMDYMQKYMISCNRQLGVKSLVSSSQLQNIEGDNKKEETMMTEGLKLQPTSIYGDGDKISLPPSILEFLTQGGGGDGSSSYDDDGSNGDMFMTSSSSPWTFRIGILNPKYTFPASPMLQKMTPPLQDSERMDDDSVSDHESEDEDEDEYLQAYLDELSYRYISYTHCTVVEFTHEDGFVGLPSPIASALLNARHRTTGTEQQVQIPVTRTVDPAAASKHQPIQQEEQEDNKEEDDATMKIVDDDEGRTPGHLAWGAFDVPDVKVEISLVKLPKGRGCTLVPTEEAVKNGFYDLQDVKLVLEQSLIRTRATLSVGDTVHTWHRGVKFDLRVTKTVPAAFHAVTCINTDIEVEIGEMQPTTTTKTATTDTTTPLTQNATTNSSSSGYTLNGGRVLSESSAQTSSTSPATTNNNTPQVSTTAHQLLEEPPTEQKEGVCTVQIRADGATGRRRFHTHHAKLNDLFAYAASIVGSDVHSFRLVTRYPRKIFTLDATSASTTMAAAGIQPGQELFLVENIH